MNFNKILSVLIALLLLTSCEKRSDNLEDYLPKVELISLEKTAGGKILATARIISHGESPIEYCGFFADDNENPSITENQVFANKIVNNQFSAEVGRTFLPETYDHLYINAFAANGLGYSIATPILIENTENIGVLPDIEPPCTLGLNQVSFISSFTDFTHISPITQIGDYKTFTASASNSKVIFTFVKLRQKEYTTALSNHDLEEDQMHIAVIVNGVSNPVYPGLPVYVIWVENNTYDIHICDAGYGFNSTLKTRVRITD